MHQIKKRFTAISSSLTGFTVIENSAKLMLNISNQDIQKSGCLYRM